MKKSKVIVPALAMIGLSAVASVTGSVAWFTAQRTGNITTNEFVVTKTDGTLECDVVGGIGTTRSAAGVISSGTNKLSDASFNPATKQLYNDVENNEGVATNFVAVGTATSYTDLAETKNDRNPVTHWYVLSSNDHVYYAYTWQVTVSYTWGSDHRDLNVFFDYTNSATTIAKQSGESGDAAQTGLGFRIAIINADASHTVVFNKQQSAAKFSTTYATNDGEAFYGTTNASNANYSYFGNDFYGFGNVACNAASESRKAIGTYAKATDSEASQTGRHDYLATISRNGDELSSSATFTCVAWFEGNDENMRNNKRMDQVTSTVAFYSAIAA